MWVFHRHPWLLAWALLLLTAPARAWVETAVESDVATVDVARNGSATVRHFMNVRYAGKRWLAPLVTTAVVVDLPTPSAPCWVLKPM